MSASIPSQDPDAKTYSESDLQHLVAREWAKHAITQLQNGQLELQKHLVELNGTFIAEVRTFRESVARLPTEISVQIRECRNDLRSEIEADFPSKMETMHMERRIEEKIMETDRTLSEQITKIDNKLTSQITQLDTKIDKIWIRITVTVSAVVACGLFLQWVFSTARSAGLGA